MFDRYIRYIRYSLTRVTTVTSVTILGCDETLDIGFKANFRFGIDW